MSNLFATPPVPPHFHQHRLSPTRSSWLPATFPQTGSPILTIATPVSSTPAQSRKRKASPSDDQDDFMSSSPSASPSFSSSTLPPPRVIKRARPNLSGRSLALPRLLETLDTTELRSVLKTICERHPELEPEITQLAPRPSVQSTLDVLHQYQDRLKSSFPFGNNPGSEYAYNRVRPAFQALLEALGDFTPQFLPPVQTQATVSLSYLDGVTQIIHDLPNWDTPSNNLAKQNAYEEIARAWAMVLREAGKRGAGMGVANGGWDEKIRRHDEQSGGRMTEAVQELRKSLGWMEGQSSGASASSANSAMAERELVRQQLLSGTYGAPGGIRTGFW